MKLLALALLLALASTAHAGYACRDLADPEGRRWFQEAPCGPGYVHDPLPDPPLIVEAPRLPDGAGWGSAGSSWQSLGRHSGYWVERGSAVRVHGGRYRGRR